jgi:hypothetical protein
MSFKLGGKNEKYRARKEFRVLSENYSGVLELTEELIRMLNFIVKTTGKKSSGF